MAQIEITDIGEITEIENSINNKAPIFILGNPFVVIGKYFKERSFNTPLIVYQLEELQGEAK